MRNKGAKVYKIAKRYGYLKLYFVSQLGLQQNAFQKEISYRKVDDDAGNVN